jgi:hypothetical protein
MTASDELAGQERTIARGLNEILAGLCDLYDRRAWAAMGYETWEAFLADKYGAFAEVAAEMVAEVRP